MKGFFIGILLCLALLTSLLAQTTKKPFITRGMKMMVRRSKMDLLINLGHCFNLLQLSLKKNLKMSK